ncbi:MAG: hypothetical protein ACOYLT_10855 [Flavobacterium sp.]|uniref:hypothetical protein n=1 Tax=Flavobacterium sp. TaxID=239 RepID=UPI003BDC9BA6
MFDSIIKEFKKDDKIKLLTKGKYDTYIGITSTKVNGKSYDKAILFEISKTNKKRITSEFIELTYNYYKENNNCFPKRDWYETHKELSHEYKSRPCNYAVAQGLINKVLTSKNN